MITDRVVEFPHRYKLKNIETGEVTGTFDFSPVPGAVVSEGSAVNANLLNQLTPIGIIAMWSGAVNAVPSGWVLCNGQNGAPDLRGRFIVGAGGSYGVGATGGVDSVTLSASQMPSHSHDFKTWRTYSDYSGSYYGLARLNNDSQSITERMTPTGGSESHENRPPYYALCYIMFKG